jgi:pimeloyl-ACP methyl ester carboxylesterase
MPTSANICFIRTVVTYMQVAARQHQVIPGHGGPAAVGNAAPLAFGLSDSFRVLEPWQRGSGTRPLTVASHIGDLQGLISARCAGTRPALVGESWGAMLALAYAAACPESVGPLVLIGCGTFDPESRARLNATLTERSEEVWPQLEALKEAILDPVERLVKRRALHKALYDYATIDPDPNEDAEEPFDLIAHTETWNDMVRLQQLGVYPAAFAAITSPVLMLHGDHDPHPGQMIRANLAPYLPQLEYAELTRCGHSPWAERFTREEFFVILHEWLKRRLPD